MPRQTKEKKKEKAESRKTLPVMMKALHLARQELSEANSSLELKQVQFEAKNKELIQRVEAARLAVEMNEGTLRETMVLQYRTTNQTALAPGLDIRMRTRVMCANDEFLREWCLTRASWLLTLDMSKVEQLAKVFPNALPYVSLEEIPTAYVTKDLSKTIMSYSPKG